MSSAVRWQALDELIHLVIAGCGDTDSRSTLCIYGWASEPSAKAVCAHHACGPTILKTAVRGFHLASPSRLAAESWSVPKGIAEVGERAVRNR